MTTPPTPSPEALAKDIMSMSDEEVLAEAAEDAALPSVLCSDCPPVGYPTDITRCLPCPRRSEARTYPGGRTKEEWSVIAEANERSTAHLEDD